jgi:hypothetical protein
MVFNVLQFLKKMKFFLAMFFIMNVLCECLASWRMGSNPRPSSQSEPVAINALVGRFVH